MDYADITAIGIADAIARKIINEIDDNTVSDNPPKYSWRVGPSSLGDVCVARQWYKFRWARLEHKPGKILRLFQRGHGAEQRFTAMLRRAGWTIQDYSKRLIFASVQGGGDDQYYALDWNEPIPDDVLDVSERPEHIAEALKRDKWILQQWRVKQFGGHMSGYLDAKGSHPVYTQGRQVLVEYKTYNTKNFVHLCGKRSVKICNPKYYTQSCIYMRDHELPWSLFLAENKNDDDIYVEIIPRDDGEALDKMATAQTIITSKARPARIGQSPAFFECKTCAFAGPCHGHEPVDINCRSCVNCEPIDGGKFHCAQWGKTIPDEKAMRAACGQHSPIK